MNSLSGYMNCWKTRKRSHESTSTYRLNVLWLFTVVFIGMPWYGYRPHSTYELPLIGLEFEPDSKIGQISADFGK